MSNALPRVSICLPAYNCEKFVGQAIESVLSQTFENFELIISDDCSTDSTLNIIKGFKDPRIRVLENKENLGMEGNWNKTLEAARGEFIKLFCNDDLLYPTCLERQVAIFDDSSNADVVLVSCKRNIIDSNGKRLLKRGQKLRGRVPGEEAIRKTISAGTNVIGEPTAVMFRADLLRSTGAFSQSIPYLIDLDLWSRLLLKGDAYIIPEALCVFRVANISASVRMAKNQSKEYSDFIDKLSSNSDFKLTTFDKIKGKAMARINGLMRQVLYRIVLQNKSEQKQ